MNNRFSRKTFIEKVLLASGASMLLPSSLVSCNKESHYNVRSIDNAQKGHLLRDFNFPPVEELIRVDTVIAGGGIAGLTAAYYLAKSGHTHFLILDLDDQPGGNSAAGLNAVTAYPLGAHYLPLVNSNNKILQEFLHEHSIIRSWDKDGKPVYDETYLCAEPNERLHIDGFWQEGLIPSATINENDRHEIQSFLKITEDFRHKKGMDGKFWFDIPLDGSSNDPENRLLDTISMSDWIKNQGWNSPYLIWYIDYCCRDDYGTSSTETSAWAGIHYFAGRKALASNAESDAVLTWPEGNNFLVKCLIKGIPASTIKNNSIVYHIEENNGVVRVHYYDIQKNKSIAIECKNCIDALPLFVHKRFQGSMAEKIRPVVQNATYAPWLVANITLNDAPVSRNGAPLSWDNVILNQESLGYVNACHQLVQSHPKQFVITYYKALAQADPREERLKAQQTSSPILAEQIMKELEKVHPNIREIVTDIELKLWGHAMIRPTKGAIWTHRLERNKIMESFSNIVFAHSDHSGISIFEEAFHQGWNAAQKLISKHQSA